MAVDALELRPRGTVALLDAAIRVCATTTGVWALTLPAGAALIAALLNLVEAVTRHQSLYQPVAWWTAAWAVRALSQGAACHYVEHQVIGTTPASTRASMKAALLRAPGLITAAMAMAIINTFLWVFTGGLGLLFLGAHAAGYAATMHGQGSALNVYGTSSKLLGNARGNAAWVRLFGFTQLLVGLNLHLTVALALYLARSVLGFDVTFVLRFVSLDNSTWLAALAITTFTLFEPLRAATGTLLLIDGRVRQEGLDLVAAVAQLPTRRKKLPPLVAPAVLAVLLSMPALGAGSLKQRLYAVTRQCDMKPATKGALDQLGPVKEADQAAFSRFVARIERTATDDEDCAAAETQLKAGLALMGQAPAAATDVDPQALARSTLERPEFQVAPPPLPVDDEANEEEAPGWFRQWWDDLWRRFWEWLRQKGPDKPRETRDPIDFGDAGTPSPMTGANAVIFVALAVVAGVLVWLLVRGRGKKERDEAALDETGALREEALSEDPASALSRPPETWAGLADELAARGEFREAIRHLYLALLSRLHRDGVIDYDATRSNWEYLLGFKGAADLKSAFRELTRRFDFAWYGNLDLTRPAWATFRATAEPILTAPPPGEAPRA